MDFLLILFSNLSSNIIKKIVKNQNNSKFKKISFYFLNLNQKLIILIH